MKNKMRISPIIVALMLLTASAHAQKTAGMEIDVSSSGTTRLKLALPAANQVGSRADMTGIRESIEQTLFRDLGLSGFFELLAPGQLLHDSAKEGAVPKFVDYFNVGAQAVVKSSFEILKSGAAGSVKIELKLFSVATEERVVLGEAFSKAVVLPNNAVEIRRFTTQFVDDVIRHFTGKKGVFSTRLAVVKRSKRGKEIFMISADGLEEVRLTRRGGLNLLPELRNNRLFFTSFRAGGPHLFELTNKKVRSVSSFSGLNTGAALSPAGDALAVTLSKDGNPEIYLLNPDTGAVLKRLTNSWGIDASPSWSPDGQMIAFVSDRHGSPQIWTMDRQGQQLKRLTFQGDYNQTPAWSPDGSSIAFTARDERNVFDVFTVKVEDSSITRLTQNQGNNEEPTWSPDGRYLVFTSTRGGRSELYLSNPDGRFQRKLSTRDGDYLTPAWGR